MKPDRKCWILVKLRADELIMNKGNAKKPLEDVTGFPHKANGSIPAAGRADPASSSGNHAISKVGKGLEEIPKSNRSAWEITSHS